MMDTQIATDIWGVLLDKGLSLVILAVAVYFLWPLFKKQNDTLIEILKEEIAKKDKVIEDQRRDIAELSVKYEAMLREQLKVYGQMSDMLREVTRNSNDLPNSVGHRLQELMTEHHEKLEVRLKDNFDRLRPMLKEDVKSALEEGGKK